jgi:hypothetical protein
MNGALMKASSRFAIAAALGLVVSAGSAGAADLGGNCCADLEERIAELEATTARKGNRKMSLTITGQVNRIVTWWDDGFQSKTYYGVDNTNSSSRFIFNGAAKVTPKVSMGFEIMIEIEAGGTSSKLNQLDEDGTLSTSTSFGVAGTTRLNIPNADAYFGDARRVAVWFEHADLGRMTVGRWETAGVLGTIDLTGHLFLVASPAFGLVMGGNYMRGPQGQWYGMTFANTADPAANNPGRTEGVRYDSPSWYGFIYSASINEAGDYWGNMVRYANEFNGFRVAGTVGYEKVHDRFTTPTLDPTSPNFTGPLPDLTVWGFALSAMHVPTGLFVQGHYNHVDFGTTALQGFAGYWGQSTDKTQKPADQWLIQAGISKNWFGYGNTSIYGEYGVAHDWAAADDGRNFAGTSATGACPGANGPCIQGQANFISVNGVVGSDLTIWGVGVVQQFSAAATDVYLGYRHFDADVFCTGAPTAQGACAGTNGATPAHKLPTEGMDVIMGGARVLF